MRTYPELIDSSPLKNKVIEGTDMIIVRELTAGLYYGTPRGIEGDRGFNTMSYTRAEIERVAHVAFKLAAQPPQETHQRRQVQRPRNLARSGAK